MENRLNYYKIERDEWSNFYQEHIIEFKIFKGPNFLERCARYLYATGASFENTLRLTSRATR